MFIFILSLFEIGVGEGVYQGFNGRTEKWYERLLSVAYTFIGFALLYWTAITNDEVSYDSVNYFATDNGIWVTVSLIALYLGVRFLVGWLLRLSKDIFKLITMHFVSILVLSLIKFLYISAAI